MKLTSEITSTLSVVFTLGVLLTGARLVGSVLVVDFAIEPSGRAGALVACTLVGSVIAGALAAISDSVRPK